MKQSIQKETELLKNKLSSYLKEFQKLNDWPSVNNWLLKLEQSFKDHPTPFIEDNLVLAKRLSQCLNQSLPVGTHKQTLTVYRLIFSNLELIKHIDDSADSQRKHIAQHLHIFSLGLFPFFHYASVQLKPNILEIIEKHFFPLEIDLIPCSAGLVICILPGLTDNNEDLQRKTFSIFEGLQNKIGKKYLYGYLWLSILRLPRTRVAAYVCLQKLFKKNDALKVNNEGNQPIQVNQFKKEEILFKKSDDFEEQSSQYSPFFKVYEQQRNIDTGIRDEQGSEEDQDDQELMIAQLNEIKNIDDIASRFPNRSALIVNALVSSLEDENNQVKKCSLDFMLNYFPLQMSNNSNLLTENDKLLLTQGVLSLLPRSEYSLVWKCHQWLFGEPDADSNFRLSENNRNILDFYIKNALINILNNTYSESNTPIKIIQTFYMKNNHMTADSLKTISFYLIKYLHKHYSNLDIQTSAQRLFDGLSTYLDVIFSSLCSHYSELKVQPTGKKEQLQKDRIFLLELIEFTFEKLFPKLSEVEFQEIKKTIQPLLSTLVSFLTNNDCQNIVEDERLVLLRCILTLLEYLNKLLEQLEKMGSDFQLISMEVNSENYISQFINYYLKLVEFINDSLKLDQNKKHESKNKSFISHSSQKQLLSLDSKQKSTDSSNQSTSHLKEQSKLVIGKEEKVLSTLDIASKVILSIQKLYLGFFDWKEVDRISEPEWLTQVFQLIDASQYSSKKVELVCIDCIIQIITANCRSPLRFEKFRSFAQQEERISKIIEILWSSLESSLAQKKIIDFLVILMGKFPQIFSQVVENSFQNQSNLNASVKSFMTFYRLTNNYITKNSSSNLGCGLFAMIELLDHKNPIIRNSVKTFLVENTQFLFRVIDPFVIELLHVQSNTKVTQKYSNFFIYQEEYDWQKILRMIKLLERIQDTLKDVLVTYIYQVKISSHLSSIISSSKFSSLFELSSTNYLGIICFIMIRFISGQSKNDIKEGAEEESEQIEDQENEEIFRAGNEQVSCSSSEMLERIMGNAEMKGAVLNILNQCLEKVLVTLKYNTNEVIQVQLLSLVATFILKFKGIYRKADKQQQQPQQLLQARMSTAPQNFDPQLKFPIEMFSSPLFFANLLEGFERTSNHFLRGRFMYVVTIGVWTLSDALSDQSLMNVLSLIFENYYSVLRSIKLDDIEESVEELDESYQLEQMDPYGDSNENSSEKITSQKRFRLSNSGQINQSQEEYEVFSESNKKLSSQSSFQEVRNICDSLKSILDYFLQLKESNSPMTFDSPSTDEVSFQKQGQTYKMASALYDIITLKIFNSNNGSNNNSSNNGTLAIDRFSSFDIKNNRVSTLQGDQSNTVEGTRKSQSLSAQAQFLQNSNGDQVFQNPIQLILGGLTELLEVYLKCWSLSKNGNSQVIFNTQGSSFYQFSEFENYNSKLQDHLSFLSNPQNDFQSQDTIRRDILSVTYPLFIRFPTQILNSLFLIWKKRSSSTFFPLFFKQKQNNNNEDMMNKSATGSKTNLQLSKIQSQAKMSQIGKEDPTDNLKMMLKTIELTSFMNVGVEFILSHLIKTPLFSQLRNYYCQRLNLGKEQALLNPSIAKQEVQALFFLFEIILYHHLDLSATSSHSNLAIWEKLLAILSIFNSSRHPSTCIWVLDIILAASRKFSPKEILGEKNIRQDLNEVIRSHLLNLAAFSTQKIVFTSTNEMNFAGKVTQAGSQDAQKQFQLFGPYSPSVNELFENYQRGIKGTHLPPENQNGQKNKNVYWEIEKKLFENTQDIEEERNSFYESIIGGQDDPESKHPFLTKDEFSLKASILSLKSLKSLLYEVLQNCFDNQQKILQLSKEVLSLIIPKIFLEKKTAEQLIIIECASDLCSRLLEQSPGFIMKEFSRSLFDVFTASDFFKCNVRILESWRCIINWLDDSGSLFCEFFEKESMFQTLMSRSDETHLKIKKFQRICFVIYSGELDKHHKQLSLLLENIGEIIKNVQSQNQHLIILVLFCLRILILRLSPRVLNDLLKTTWPILLTLLLQIFDKPLNNPNYQISSKSSQNTFTVSPNLVLAALKLIEQISYVQLDEFYFHQWIFVLDYFGVAIQLQDSNSNSQQAKLITPFTTAPVLSSFFPSGYKSDFKNSLLNDDITHSYQKLHRPIIMTMTHVSEIEELQNKVLFFCQHLINLNQQRWQIDLKPLENVVEQDFIAFGEHIYRNKSH